MHRHCRVAGFVCGCGGLKPSVDLLSIRPTSHLAVFLHPRMIRSGVDKNTESFTAHVGVSKDQGP